MHLPPAVTAQIAESSVDHAGYELAPGDEEGVDSDQLTSEVRGGNFSNVDRNRHGGDAWLGGGGWVTGGASSPHFTWRPTSLTYAQTHYDSAHEEHHLVRCHAQHDASDAEDETGYEDADPASQPPIQGSSTQGRERRGPDGAGDQQLLPQGIQPHLLLQQQHGPGDHPGVVAEEEASQGTEERQHVDEPRRGCILLREVPGWRSNETPLSIICCFLPASAHKVAHVLQAVFIAAAGHEGNQENGASGVSSAAAAAALWDLHGCCAGTLIKPPRNVT